MGQERCESRQVHLRCIVLAPVYRMGDGFRVGALHARRLALTHPATGRECAWTAPPPSDLRALLAALTADGGGARRKET